jgi:hypothetical protein
MSLINEALKKAQRARTDGAGAAASEGERTGQIAKRGRPTSARTMLLLGAAAVVLVVGSMVATALWLTRPAGSPPPATAVPIAIAPAPANESAPPVIVVPPTTLPTPGPTMAAKPVPRVATEASPPTAANPAPLAQPTTPAMAEAPVTAAPAPVIPMAPAVAKPSPKPDERIHQFVESIRVAGIRSSGADSKVLMNDRVYRVNDIVDRSLGLRLTKVSADSLTFTDANGVTYVKYF